TLDITFLPTRRSSDLNRDSPVHEVSPLDSLQAEHERLVELVQKNGSFSVHTHYTGKAYRPHITVRGDRSIDPGRVLRFDDLYIVDRKRTRLNSSHVKI